MTLIPKLLWNRTSWLGVHYDFLEQFQQIPVLTAKGVSEDNPLLPSSTPTMSSTSTFIYSDVLRSTCK